MNPLHVKRRRYKIRLSDVDMQGKALHNAGMQHKVPHSKETLPLAPNQSAATAGFDLEQKIVVLLFAAIEYGLI